jgi:hypothetical protein
MSIAKIQRTHCERLACVYVRQSTPDQMQHHQESTERQYHLRERALALGWPTSGVEIIDEDQGRSGRTAAHRLGFQRLISQVSLGQVGLVLMLEASRLARNNSDWHYLIEICGLRGTLIADEGAVYDPRDPNDRLLLGVKGTLSEAEVFTLRTRLYEGRWNKARTHCLMEECNPCGVVASRDILPRLPHNGRLRSARTALCQHTDAVEPPRLTQGRRSRNGVQGAGPLVRRSRTGGMGRPPVPLTGPLPPPPLAAPHMPRKGEKGRLTSVTQISYNTCVTV